MVRNGLEPTVTGVGSNEDEEVELRGIEPLTFALPARCSPS
jgi:hypothetical protein